MVINAVNLETSYEQLLTSNLGQHFPGIPVWIRTEIENNIRMRFIEGYALIGIGILLAIRLTLLLTKNQKSNLAVIRPVVNHDAVARQKKKLQPTRTRRRPAALSEEINHKANRD